MSYVYRGEPLERLMRHELRDGFVQEQTVDVYEIDDSVPREDIEWDNRSAFFGMSIDELSRELGAPIEKKPVTFTPGFTYNIGTAIFFSWYGREDKPGLVFSFDESAISGLIPVEYTANLTDGEPDAEFADAHPGITARVEQLAEAEIRWRDQIVGLYYDGGVNKWNGAARSRLSGVYDSEAEAFTHDRVDLDSTVSGVFSFVGESPALGGSLKHTLGSMDGYKAGWGTATESGQDVDYLSEDEQLIAYYDALVDEMPRYEQQVMVIVVEQISKHHDTIAEKFVKAYDGSRMIEDYQSLPASLGYSP